MFVCLFVGLVGRVTEWNEQGFFSFSIGVCRFTVFLFFRRRDVAIFCVCLIYCTVTRFIDSNSV